MTSSPSARLRQELHSDSAGKCRVATRRLDDDDVGRLGFIKIDVEGSELNVLRGAEETIRAHKPVLLIEIDERWSGMPVEESLGFVCDLGYEGVFFADGLLRSLQSFDPVENHRQPGSFVHDFFFLPR